MGRGVVVVVVVVVVVRGVVVVGFLVVVVVVDCCCCWMVFSCDHIKMADRHCVWVLVCVCVWGNHAGSWLFWSSCNTGFRESGSGAGTGFVFECVFVYLIDWLNEGVGYRVLNTVVDFVCMVIGIRIGCSSSIHLARNEFVFRFVVHDRESRTPSEFRVHENRLYLLCTDRDWKKERGRIFKITIRQSLVLTLLTCMVCRHAHRAGSGPSRVHSHHHRDTGCGGRRRARDYRLHGDKVVAYDDTDLNHWKSKERERALEVSYRLSINVSLVSVCCCMWVSISISIYYEFTG